MSICYSIYCTLASFSPSLGRFSIKLPASKPGYSSSSDRAADSCDENSICWVVACEGSNDYFHSLTSTDPSGTFSSSCVIFFASLIFSAFYAFYTNSPNFYRTCFLATYCLASSSLCCFSASLVGYLAFFANRANFHSRSAAASVFSSSGSRIFTGPGIVLISPNYSSTFAS